MKVSVLILLTIAVVYGLYRYFVYVPSLFTYLTTRRQISQPSKQRTAALQQLVKAPTFGQFFLRDLISDFVTKNQWQKVLNYSQQAIQSPISKDSFSIWYYKATAQCLLNRAQDCQRSARIANSLLPHGTEDYVSQLFNLAKIMKNNQKIKMVTSNDIITIMLDNKQDQQKQQPKQTNKNQHKHEHQTVQQKQSVNNQQTKIKQNSHRQTDQNIIHDKDDHKNNDKVNKNIDLMEL